MAVETLLAAALAGGGAWLTGRQASRRERAAAAGWPAGGQLVEVDGHRIHAHVEGEGPDLVLIHGANGNTRDFTFSLTARLRDRYRVIALDRPGFGWSESAGAAGVSPRAQARILQAAAAKLGVTRPIVLGQSYGGAVAMGWALNQPATAALVVVSGATMPWTGRLGLWYRIPASRAGRAMLVPLAAAFWPYRSVQRVLPAIFAPDPVPPGYAEAIALPMILRRGPLRTNALQINGLNLHLAAMAADYPGLALPVELVHGESDAVVSARTNAVALARLLPGAALDLIPGAGHMPHHSHADRVIAAIDRARLRAAL